MPQVLSLHRIPSGTGELTGRFFENDFYGTNASGNRYTTHYSVVTDNLVLNSITVNVLSTTRKIIVFAVGVGATFANPSTFNLVLTRNGVQLLGDIPVSDGPNPRNGITSIVLDPELAGEQTFTLQGARLVPNESLLQSHHLRIVLLDEDGSSSSSG